MSERTGGLLISPGRQARKDVAALETRVAVLEETVNTLSRKLERLLMKLEEKP